MISRLWQQNSVEFGKKNVQCWAREIYAQMKWILRGEAPESRQRDRAVTGKSANERGRTSFCSRFRSVRNSSILLKTRIFILSGKSVKLHDWPIMGSQLLVRWTTSCFLLYQDCHLFQQQFVFNIEIDGWSSHDSKWQACMRETDADRSWQACHGRPWTSIKNFSDEMYKENPTQDIPDFLQPFTVNLEDLETCARTFLWKSELRFGRWRFKSGDIKMEA